MPIKGNILYPFRWWYRATVANSIPIPQATEAAEQKLISATAMPPRKPLPLASKK